MRSAYVRTYDRTLTRSSTRTEAESVVCVSEAQCIGGRKTLPHADLENYRYALSRSVRPFFFAVMARNSASENYFGPPQGQAATMLAPGAGGPKYCAARIFSGILCFCLSLAAQQQQQHQAVINYQHTR